MPNIDAGGGLPDLAFAAVVPLVSLLVVGTAVALIATVLGTLTAWTLVRGDARPIQGSAELFTSLTGVLESTGEIDAASFSDDERFVVELLRENDGRVRQSEIVDASNWSKSKVSRLLSSMERNGYVEKVTIGRENAIVLALNNGR